MRCPNCKVEALFKSTSYGVECLNCGHTSSIELAPETPSEQFMQEELERCEDDIKELNQYERNLRQALKSIEEYTNKWQEQIRRMRKEIECIERKRLEIETSTIMQRKRVKKEKNIVDDYLKKFAKMGKVQREKLIADLCNC